VKHQLSNTQNTKKVDKLAKNQSSQINMDVANIEQASTLSDEYNKHFFASSQIYAESLNYKPIVRPFTKEQIDKALKNPLQNYETLQHMSNYLYAVSSAYQNTIDYFSNILAFDYIISPTDYTDNKTTMMNRFLGAAKKMKQLQAKSVFPKVIERTLIQGESYWYTLTDSDNVIFVEIPAKFCEVYEIDSNNIFRYKIKLNLLNDNIVKSMPLEIKTAYESFKTNKNQKVQKLDKNDAMNSLKYEVSEKGFAVLAHGLLNIHDYPYFANMFTDLLMLEENKEYLDEYIKNDNVKMVHQKVGVDKDSGKPLLDKDVIQAYHNSTKNHVPSNVSVSTSPFEVAAISFDNSSKTQINLVEQSKDNVQDDSGVSSLVFNNEKSSSNALKDSIRADKNRVVSLLKYFNAVATYQIKTFKFIATFLETDRFTKSDDHEDARTDLQSGGNRMLFLATSNMELYDYLQIAQLEKIIEIDDYLPIMIPGSQQSGLDPNNRGGRPIGEKGNITDNGETSQEYR
jgi:hypothetical protein